MCEKYDRKKWMGFLLEDRPQEFLDQMKNHLGDCKTCRRVVRSLRAIREKGGNWYAQNRHSLSDETKEKMIDGILEKTRQTKKENGTSFVIREWMRSAAAALVFFLLSLLALYQFTIGLPGFEQNKPSKHAEKTEPDLHRRAESWRTLSETNQDKATPLEFYKSFICCKSKNLNNEKR